MNNEIKEILDYLKEFIDEDRLEQINLNRWFVSSLLDYITNLQQEINELEKWLIERIDNVPETMAEVYEDKLILEKIKELEEYEEREEMQYLIKDEERFNYSMSDQVDY